MEQYGTSNASNYTNSTFPDRDNSSPSSAPLVVVFMLECTCLVVILGNLLVIFAYCTYKKRASPDILIFSLSLADLLDSTAALQMLVIIKYILVIPWTRVLCDVFIVQLYTYRTASASTVTFMAAERALLLMYPIKHRNMVTQQRTSKVILGIWAFSFLCGVLPIGVGHSSFDRQHHLCPYQLYDLGIAYTVLVEVLGGLMLLVTLISFIVIKISSGKFLRRQSSLGLSLRYSTQEEPGKGDEPRRCRGRKRSHSTAGMTSMRRLTLMMTIVVVVYFISWMPFLLNNLVSVLRSQPPNQSVSLFAAVISLLHAVANPVLYGKMSQRYRKGYVHVIKSFLMVCGGKKPTRHVTNTSHQSNTAPLPAHAYSSQVTAAADNPGYCADPDIEGISKEISSLAEGPNINGRMLQQSSDAVKTKMEHHVTAAVDKELVDTSQERFEVEKVLEEILRAVDIDVMRCEKGTTT